MQAHAPSACPRSHPHAHTHKHACTQAHTRTLTTRTHPRMHSCTHALTRPSVWRCSCCGCLFGRVMLSASNGRVSNSLARRDRGLPQNVVLSATGTSKVPVLRGIQIWRVRHHVTTGPPHSTARRITPRPRATAAEPGGAVGGLTPSRGPGGCSAGGPLTASLSRRRGPRPVLLFASRFLGA